mmetsp:Transcript_42037/g.76315  ORF Transcript_42037/g.76315 Transcript_42037/m.76315 type:complete len:203 (+) Transcript_42037:41-649(+)
MQMKRRPCRREGAKPAALLLAVVGSLCFRSGLSWTGLHQGNKVESNRMAWRRQVLTVPIFAGISTGAVYPQSAHAAESAAQLLAALREQRALLDPILARIDDKQWDSIRFTLKNPPLQYIWDCAMAKNTVRKLGEVLADEEILAAFEEITSGMQSVDEYMYTNAFVYTQPGSGKFKIDEPKSELRKVMQSLDRVIQLASSQV